MFARTTFSVRGWTRDEADRLAEDFIYKRRRDKNERWEASAPEKQKTGVLRLKPWVIVLTREA